RLAKTITTGYMTGYLRNYFQYIFISFVLLIVFALFKLNAFSFNLADDTPVGIFQWILAITFIIAGITMIMANSRLTVIVLNGYIGFSIALFFVLFRTTDLSSTQIIVASLTPTPFLLVIL